MKSALERPEEPTGDRYPDRGPDLHLAARPEAADPGNPGGGTFKRFLRYVYNRFIRLHGSPEDIAWGSAMGLFIAMSPTMGLQMCMAVATAAFFKVNKVAAAATVWITNPATAPVIYWVNYQIGAKLFGYPIDPGFLANPSWETFWNAGKHVFFSLLIGGGITGAVLAVVGYVVTLNMVYAARRKARRLREKRAAG